MALQKQVITIPVSGQDDKTAPVWRQMGKLKTLENGRMGRLGEIRKRNGYTSLDTAIIGGGDITAGRSLTQHRGALVLETDADVYTYDETGDQWRDVGNTSPFVAESHDVWDVGRSFTGGSGIAEVVAPTVTYGNGRIFCAWGGPSRTLGGNRYLYYAIYDADTMATIVPPTNASQFITDAGGPSLYFTTGSSGITTCGPRAFYDATAAAYLVFAGTLGRIVKVAESDLTTPTVVSFTGTTTHVDRTMDVSAMANGNYLLAADDNSSLGLRVIEATRAGVVVTNTFYATTRPNKAVCILDHDQADGKAYIATAESTNGVRVFDYTISGATIAAPVTLDATATDVRQLSGWYDTATTTRVCIFEEYAASSINRFITKASKAAGAAVTATLVRGCGLVSKTFESAGKRRFIAVYYSAPTGAYYAMDEDGAVCAHVAFGYAGGLRTGDNCPGQIAEFSSTKHGFSAGRNVRLDWNYAKRNYDAGDQGVFFCALDNDDYGKAPGVEANGILAIPGANPVMMDGGRTVDFAPLVVPVISSVAQTTSGSLTLTKTYQIAAIYSVMDDAGNWHRSAPSILEAVTLTGSNTKITFNVSTLRVRNEVARPLDGTIDVYLSAGDGSVLYLNQNARNVPTSDAVAFSVTAEVTTSEIIYTQGGVLANFPPPPCRQFVQHDNRLWAIGCEDSATVWPSKELRIAAAPAWNPDLALTVDEAEGGIFCGASMDTHLVLFARNAIYVVSGQGPNDLGQGGYAGPSLVTTRVGCTRPRSITLTPKGLIFQSSKGVYLLDRGLQASYIGSPVEDHNAETVTAAVVVPDDNEVRLFTAAGTTLVWNWHFDQWGTDTSQACVSASVLDRSQVAYMSAAGLVKKEVSGQYNDDGAAIVTKVRTAPLQVAGVHGFARLYEVQLIGEYLGAHTLHMAAYVDHDSVADETRSIVLAGAPWRPSLRAKTQRLTAVEIEIYDSFPGAKTQGFRLSSIGLLVGIKGGAGRLAASSRMT